jgi:hypothetical protein
MSTTVQHGTESRSYPFDFFVFVPKSEQEKNQECLAADLTLIYVPCRTAKRVARAIPT